MAAAKNLSLIAKFDELCRGFNHLIGDSHHEFSVFARGQEECRQKWLSAQVMCANLQKQLDETRSNEGRLELQIRHVTELLKQEIQIRQRLQKDEKDLERKLAMVRQIVTTDRSLTEETRDKLATISSFDSWDGTSSQGDSPGRHLDSSDNECSTRSMLSSLDYSHEKTDDDLELSIIRSVRDVRDVHTLAVPGASDRRHSLRKQSPRNDGADEHQGTYVVETLVVPAMTPTRHLGRDDGSDGHLPSAASEGPSSQVRPLRRSLSGKRAVRQHNFASKVILKHEICVPCKTRIRFGKSALKCVDCLAATHVECKASMPTPCVPTVRTPSHFVGAIADYCPVSTPMIPALVVHCANEIEARGLRESGLYRVNVLDRDVRPLKEQLLQGKMTPTQLSTINVHVLCAVLKSFLASLKEPLVTWTMRESFTRIAYVTDDTDVQTSVCVLVPELPQPSRDTLAFLVLHLQRIAESAECRMSLSNLSKIFAPILIGQPRTILDNGLKKLQDMKEQQLTMEKLLTIPSDYWSCYGKYTESAYTPVYKPKRNSKRAPYFPSPHF